MNSQMSTDAVIKSSINVPATPLRKLYFTRAAFSLAWVVLVALFAKTNQNLAITLLIVYPAWDAIATFWDIRSNTSSLSKTPQYVNVVISVITTISVAIAVQKSIPDTLIVFGAWAILTGLIQLIIGILRRKTVNGQWPMIISGAQSTIGGSSFIILAHAPSSGINSLVGYAAFGAFYFLLAALRLLKKTKAA